MSKKSPYLEDLEHLFEQAEAASSFDDPAFDQLSDALLTQLPSELEQMIPLDTQLAGLAHEHSLNLEKPPSFDLDLVPLSSSLPTEIRENHIVGAQTEGKITTQESKKEQEPAMMTPPAINTSTFSTLLVLGITVVVASALVYGFIINPTIGLAPGNGKQTVSDKSPSEEDTTKTHEDIAGPVKPSFEEKQSKKTRKESKERRVRRGEGDGVRKERRRRVVRRRRRSRQDRLAFAFPQKELSSSSQEQEAMKALYTKATKQLLSGDNKGAISTCNQALSYQSSYAPCHRVLGIAYKQLGKREFACQYFVSAHYLKPSSPLRKNIHDLNCHTLEVPDKALPRQIEQAVSSALDVIKLYCKGDSTVTEAITLRLSFEIQYGHVMELAFESEGRMLAGNSDRFEVCVENILFSTPFPLTREQIEYKAKHKI